jgi:hypothetical protein
MEVIMDVRAEHVLVSMKQMAWARAKGELESMKCTSWVGDNKTETDKFDKMSDKIDRFIEEMEGEGLSE